ncbi:PspC domain-containing protein [Mucilaginibacter sp. FT3.2]|uniref:PspC domain-containing protein n=1 Tax=Mucilaginibacter sp. FT3.2 TaxID=2723090 RepID=UPI0016151BF8|nr:PspC domain-containing protein [Mucilaginibacter sp. FT3.2]MBB6233448.1 phage shock protein PspC (stress-responsive transcriptional regulator) [Mucilaginibacter sp. FT3.2]
MEKKLYRDESRKSIGGVCAGLAEYFDMDIAIVRALFLLTFIFMGTGFMAYIVLWIVIPKKNIGYFNPGVDYRVHPQQPYNPFDASGPTAAGAPFEAIPPKKSSSPAGVIIGMILICFGAIFLLHELDIFRFWHVAKAWPAILVIAGLAMMVSGQKKQPWEKEGWHNADAGQQAPTTDGPLTQEEKKDDSLNNTPPTI